MKSPRLLIVVAALLLASLACTLGVPTVDENSVASGGVLFQDDFSNTSSGWDKVQSAGEGMTDYQNGTYRIQVLTTNTEVWANPGLKFTNVHIEVDAQKIGGPDNNDMGVLCRYQDDNNFYYMIVSSDGYYGIVKVKDGEQKLLGQDNLMPSESINLGDATNHIRGDCVGSTLTLYVNGYQLATAEDTEFTAGDVGLVAGTYEESGADISFDNFTVTKP